MAASVDEVLRGRARRVRSRTDPAQLHLWLEHGRTRQTADFELVTTEDSAYKLAYELRFKQPVRGAKVDAGYMPKSFRCEPRAAGYVAR